MLSVESRSHPPASQDTLAKLYAVESERARGGILGGASSLNETTTAQLEECLLFARDASAETDPGSWSAATWLDSLGLGEAIAAALLKRLRGRSSQRAWLERAFVSALGKKGGRELVRCLLLDNAPLLIDALSDRVWRGIDAIADEDLSLARTAEAEQRALSQLGLGQAGDDYGGNLGGGGGGGGGAGGASFGSVAFSAALANPAEREPLHESLRLNGEPTYFEVAPRSAHGGGQSPGKSGGLGVGPLGSSQPTPAPQSSPGGGLVPLRGGAPSGFAQPAPLVPLRNLEARETGMTQRYDAANGFAGLEHAPQHQQHQQQHYRSTHVSQLPVAQAGVMPQADRVGGARRQLEMGGGGAVAAAPPPATYRQRAPAPVESPGSAARSPVALASAKRASSMHGAEDDDSGDEYGYGEY